VSSLLWIDPEDEETPFPPVRHALRDPDGLLAIGGSLSVNRLLEAYRRGIFPWYAEGQPVLWWSPDPRTVLYPDRLHITRSLRRSLRRPEFRVTFDRAFNEVMAGCAGIRHGQDGTWITDDMRTAYANFHAAGYVHSVEVWHRDQLAGGLYGVALGGIFFGESMFSRVADSSKIALAHLCAHLSAWSFKVIDCQTRTEHLLRLGAESLARERFLTLLHSALASPSHIGPWTADSAVMQTLVQSGGIAQSSRA
jgi:leucyl/phenylalanyl-tRNA--protein transferase